jgi:hypothetical protein
MGSLSTRILIFADLANDLRAYYTFQLLIEKLNVGTVSEIIVGTKVLLAVLSG